MEKQQHKKQVSGNEVILRESAFSCMDYLAVLVAAEAVFEGAYLYCQELGGVSYRKATIYL